MGQVPCRHAGRRPDRAGAARRERGRMGAMELAAGQVHSDGGGLPQLVVVPAGRFLLGSPEAEPGHEDCESPQREIAIARPFALGRTAVTFAEWDAYAVETGDVSPADEGWGRDDRPVVNVSWHDAQRYV